MKIGEAHTFRMQVVQVRRFKKRMPVRTDISVALIICQYDDNIWMVGLRRLGGVKHRQRGQQQGGQKYDRVFHYKLKFVGFVVI